MVVVHVLTYSSKLIDFVGKFFCREVVLLQGSDLLTFVRSSKPDLKFFQLYLHFGLFAQNTRKLLIFFL